MKNHMRTFTLFLLLLFIPGILFAVGTGIIKGIISDAQTGDRLPGAAIVVKQNFLGTYSNLDGEFILTNVPVGTNTLTISYLGYQEQEITVEIAEDETKTIEVNMDVLTTELAEVVVTAQIRGQRAAINQQLASNTVSNIISSEKIEELPDANAAEAIGRLPGISLKRTAGEADKIVIRGLSPKYNNVTIEGIKMASTDDFDRSVDLSLVQSELLAGIEISKSLRADMDADALGGTVNLRLLPAPEQRQIDLSLEGGYANITKDFGNYKALVGFSDRFFDHRLGVSLKVSRELKQMPSHRFNGTYSGAYWSFETGEGGAVIDSSLLTRTRQANFIDQHQSRTRTNGSLIMDYRTNWWDVKFFNMFSQKNDDVLTRDNAYLFYQAGTPQNFSLDIKEAFWKTFTRTHTLQNTFRFGRSKIILDLSTTYAEAKEHEQDFPFVEMNDYGLNQNSLVYRQPKSIMEEIGGPSSLKIEDSYLREWTMARQSLIDESYDARLDYELSYSLFSNISGKLQLGGKYHKLTRTSDGTSRYSSFEWGGGVVRRQAFLEMFPWATTDINSQRGLSAHNFVDDSYDPGKFLNGRYELGWTADVDLLTDLQDEYYTGDTDPKYFLRGVESFERDYKATENLAAGYIMTEINIGRKLMLLPGIRVEKNATEYFAYHIRTNSGQTGIDANPDSVTTKRNNTKWFPSVNMKFRFNDIVSLQAAAYKSTSRPSFRQISPLVIYPTTGNDIQSNNPYLEPSTAWNFDLGVSVKSDKIGLFTVYGFHKEIKDLIFVMDNYKPAKKGLIVGGPADLNDRILGAEYYDPFYLTRDGQTDLPFNNTEKAYVNGLEFSWQTNFWYLPGLLKGLVLDINYTILQTKTKYPFFESVVVDIDSSGFIPQPIYGQRYRTRSGPMQDQPKSILNVILGWDYKGFSSRISYRYQSKTVESLDTRYSVFDSYYDTFSLIDLMLNQKITKNIAVYANLTNIGNHIDDYYFGEQKGDTEAKNRPALPTSSQFYGFRAQFGVKVNL
jgi:TonB-dependent receptor